MQNYLQDLPKMTDTPRKVHGVSQMCFLSLVSSSGKAVQHALLLAFPFDFELTCPGFLYLLCGQMEKKIKFVRHQVSDTGAYKNHEGCRSSY